MPYTAEEVKLKELLKAAVVEVLEERSDLVREALAEAVEDLGMVRAIKEGARSEPVSRDEIFRASTTWTTCDSTSDSWKGNARVRLAMSSVTGRDTPSTSTLGAI